MLLLSSQDGIFRLREAKNLCLLSLEGAQIARWLAEEWYSVTKVGVAKFLRCYRRLEVFLTSQETIGEELVRIVKAEGVEASVSSVLRSRKDLA